MNSALSSILRRSVLATLKSNRYAVFQQAARYSDEHKCIRDLVKFPWIWPSDSETAPKRSYTPSINPSFVVEKWLWRLSDHVGYNTTIYRIFGELSYMDMIRDQVIPSTLTRIVDSLNKKDYDELDELMTPDLIALYKTAIEDLDAQGFRIHFEIDIDESAVTDDYGLLRYGDPDAYDNNIPFEERYDKYVIKGTRRVAIVEYRVRDDETEHDALRREVGTNAFIDYISLESGFKVNANIKVDLYKDDKVVDSDSGTMAIPVSISTPYYVNLKAMADAAKAAQGEETDEPFEWRVCDLFYTMNRINEEETAKADAIAMAEEEAYDDDDDEEYEEDDEEDEEDDEEDEEEDEEDEKDDEEDEEDDKKRKEEKEKKDK